jgi:lysophospholipase L1-like esterase
VVLPGTPNGKTLDALRKDWDPNVDFQHIACAGARTHNVMATKKLDGSPASANASGQLPNGTQGEVTQLDSGFVDRNTTLVMLSIGGNDAGWSDVVQGCLPEHCVDPNFSVPNFPAPVTESVPRRIRDVVKPDVNRVVAEIRERAPNAWIVLVGYPRLLKEGSDLSVAVPGFTWGLSKDEVNFLNDMARVAATELLPADMEHKVAAIDVRTYFDGHEVGWGFDNYINSYNVGDAYYDPDDDGEADSSKIGAGSFHPNVDGYQAYRRAVEDLLPVMNYRWS